MGCTTVTMSTMMTSTEAAMRTARQNQGCS
jgi:hypothetical protein